MNFPTATSACRRANCSVRGGSCEWHHHQYSIAHRAEPMPLTLRGVQSIRGALPHPVGREYSAVVGTIYYGGSATPIHIEDRALAHLKVVIASKLRRHESFTVTWQHPE